VETFQEFGKPDSGEPAYRKEKGRSTPKHQMSNFPLACVLEEDLSIVIGLDSEYQRLRRV